MRLLFLGDVVGRPGRRAVTQVLSRLRRAHEIDVVVANGENAAGGKGIDPRSAEELRTAGVDVITTGNHVWQHRSVIPFLCEHDWVLRPLNYPPGVPGSGYTIVRGRRSGVAVAVVNLIGRVFMPPADCPFRAATDALAMIGETATVILVDMHAEATSEKVAMGRFLDGRVSVVVGSHTHVQTADERILKGGTAVLTDAGMCGPEESVLGVDPQVVVDRFQNQMPARFEVAGGPVVVQGLVATIDAETGRATAVSRIQERVEVA